ncbi:hypothetical protein [Peribacillus sp. NPDC056705]|uniref:hypothetical protein n=1 Tax=Peribacillus sp. NPDC056705 TaxID=3345918 RepID=UPI0037496535
MARRVIRLKKEGPRDDDSEGLDYCWRFALLFGNNDRSSPGNYDGVRPQRRPSCETCNQSTTCHLRRKRYSGYGMPDQHRRISHPEHTITSPEYTEDRPSAVIIGPGRSLLLPKQNVLAHIPVSRTKLC